MRLWHYKTISFLPEAQLLGQWRECCAIAQEWATDESKVFKHPFTRPLLDYPYEDFVVYVKLVMNEMVNRGYNVQQYTVARLFDNLFKIGRLSTVKKPEIIRKEINAIWELPDFSDICIFDKWHNNTYLEINYWNLYEKYLSGCVPDEEWNRYLEGGREFV